MTIVKKSEIIEFQDLPLYSDAQKKVYKYCFMKQKCQIQMGTAQFKNVATPLGFWGINTTHQHFQKNFSSRSFKFIS